MSRVRRGKTLTRPARLAVLALARDRRARRLLRQPRPARRPRADRLRARQDPPRRRLAHGAVRRRDRRCAARCRLPGRRPVDRARRLRLLRVRHLRRAHRLPGPACRAAGVARRVPPRRRARELGDQPAVVVVAVPRHPRRRAGGHPGVDGAGARHGAGIGRPALLGDDPAPQRRRGRLGLLRERVGEGARRAARRLACRGHLGVRHLRDLHQVPRGRQRAPGAHRGPPALHARRHRPRGAVDRRRPCAGRRARSAGG